MRILPLLLLCCCSATEAAPPATTWLIGATRLPEGDLVDIRLDGSTIGAVEPTTGDREGVDLRGRFVVPAFIDSHVHLAYYPVAEQLAAAGIAAAVDHAAPIDTLSSEEGPIRQLRAGPMVTSVAGYPTQSWGAGGYGIECANAEEAVAAVDRLADAGADLIKLPFSGGRSLGPKAARAAVERAHARGLLVSAHALNGAEADAAADAGADLLAHTPVSSLTATQAARWSGKAVVSTLGAFGASEGAIANLRALKQAGARVLYGTDLGNSRTAGIDGRELDHLQRAGMTFEQILMSGTSSASEYWNFSDLGSLRAGGEASLLVLETDPRQDLGALARPERVWLRGVAR